MDAAEFRLAFDAWERPCRGGLTWETPVALEPPHAAFSDIRSVQTSESWRTLFASDPLSADALRALGIAPRSEPAPVEAMAELQIRVDSRISASGLRGVRLLQQLHTLAHPVAYELVSRGGQITAQFCCSDLDAELVQDAVNSF